ncbi:hypothetical protein HD806DRAFT_43758 [Xylariaceae sp. AK1471]|nr:hypothetical protein HD806DRAFT_43758 [Xylariaceae sp. AK1471]
MPFARTNAPPWVPEEETIESLLSERNESDRKTGQIKTLQELSAHQKARQNLIELGVRRMRIEGDPWGEYLSWAGNIGHPKDPRIFEILDPLLVKLQNTPIQENQDIARLRQILEKTATHDIHSLAKEFSNYGVYNIEQDDVFELVATFRMGPRTIRLMQAKDLDVNDPKSYNKSNRAKVSNKKVRNIVPEPAMKIPVQQYLVAKHLATSHGQKLAKEHQKQQSVEDSDEMGDLDIDLLEKLRTLAQEEYWLLSTKTEREDYNSAAERPHISHSPKLQTALHLVKATWPQKWDNGRYDPDFFRNYLEDQRAAAEVWRLIDEDIFIVTDARRRIVFTNIEKLGHLLLGDEGMQTLYRCADMWAFFTPLPLPETARHVVDSHIRRIHPELDPSKATVATLPNARMAVAHYGCWTARGDREGRRICRTYDARFVKSQSLENPADLFALFSTAVLGTATKMFRFLMKPLDPGFYEEGKEIWRNLPPEQRLTTINDTDGDEDFLSLFAFGVNGYTQRHRDIQDISGGLAGLFSFGDYKGGNLCIPQLGIKVKYDPGTCAILRGTALDHLVQDYERTRFFIIGTNHESCKRYAWRELGRLPPLPPRKKKRPAAILEESSEEVATTRGIAGEKDAKNDNHDGDEVGGFRPMEAPCVNIRSDDDDDDEIQWTNDLLHGSAALPLAGLVDLNEQEKDA